MYIYIYINWAAPTIDIYLFVDYPPMNIYINWAAPTVDILVVCGLPSDEYISTGPLRRLMLFIWTTLRYFIF